MGLEKPENWQSSSAGFGLGPSEQVGGAFGQALAAAACLPPQPQPGEKWELWLLLSLLWFAGLLASPQEAVSKGWSLPILPGTEPFPLV